MSFEIILEKAEKDIEQYGWSAMYVDADSENGIETFSHTIGFEETYKHPEIIIFGLPAESAHAILSAIAHEIKQGESMPLHTPVGNILGGDFKVIFKPFDPGAHGDYLNVAVGSYKTSEFRTQLMLWPDKNGQFPTEAGYSISGQRSALQLIASSDESFDVSDEKTPRNLH